MENFLCHSRRAAGRVHHHDPARAGRAEVAGALARHHRGWHFVHLRGSHLLQRGWPEGRRLAEQPSFTWMDTGSYSFDKLQFNVPVTLRADHLTAVMLLVVTSVGFLVHVYSVGYMHGDGGYYRFSPICRSSYSAC
jgi:hypothetical protein